MGLGSLPRCRPDVPLPGVGMERYIGSLSLWSRPGSQNSHSAEVQPQPGQQLSPTSQASNKRQEISLPPFTQHSCYLTLRSTCYQLTAMKVLPTRVVFVKLNPNISIWEILALENSVQPQEGLVMRDVFHKFSFIKWTLHACKRFKPVFTCY